MTWQKSSVFRATDGPSFGRQSMIGAPASQASNSAAAPSRQATILVADDDKSIRTVLSQALGRLGHHVRSTANGTTLWKWVQEGAGDLVITDVMMPDSNGLELLPKIRHIRPDLKIIVMSAQNTLMTAVQATERGAFEYLPKPFELAELIKTVEQAITERFHPSDDGAETLHVEAGFPIVGRSTAMQEVYRVIARVVAAPINVMLVGEPGTGKELAARTIHGLAGGRAENFIVCNLGGITDENLDQIFAGDASGQKPSLFEKAAGGTLFLDDPADLSAAAQARLQRILQQGGYHRASDGQFAPLRCRFISSTHHDLNALAADGMFRLDLLYRMEELRLPLPPLRDRVDDIGELVDHFLRLYQPPSAIKSTGGRQISASAKAALATHSWPGNVRELENFVKRLLVLYSQSDIGVSVVDRELNVLRDAQLSAKERSKDYFSPADYLKQQRPRNVDGNERGRMDVGENRWRNSNPQVRDAGTLSDSVETHLRQYFAAHGDDLPPPGLYHRILRELERPLFELSLAATKGNQIKTAELLGLNRNTVRKKLRDLDIDVVRGVGSPKRRDV